MAKLRLMVGHMDSSTRGSWPTRLRQRLAEFDRQHQRSYPWRDARLGDGQERSPPPSDMDWKGALLGLLTFPIAVAFIWALALSPYWIAGLLFDLAAWLFR